MLRRHALFLLLPFAAGASPSSGTPPRSLGFGPVALGMPRADAVRALGPQVLVAPLCQGTEGALFDWDVPALAPAPGRRVPAMVMFGGAGGAPDAVSEIEATSAQPGARLDAVAWQALLQRQATAAAAGSGRRFAEVERSLQPQGRTVLLRLDHPSGTLHLAARWMRAGGCHTRLHWLATGARAVIA